MQKITRIWLPGAVLLVGLCFVIPSSRAQEAGDHMKMSGDSMMKMSPEEMKMAGEHMDKMKMMAAEHPQETASDIARMMVMDKMAMHMAMDPSFLHMLQQSMSDPNMKKVHEDARKMAEDPAQMAKIKQQIMDDPKAMQIVMHLAMTNSGMMHHGMTQEGMTKDSQMKDMPAEKK
ncbi:MAG TPA: hypothetical protein VK797_25715 [Tepidisphaeraceae bacterium]|jgi:hypothetical protein|nr:hypothetical protein [Tepidisphaeraceae bacterium]